MSRCEEIRELLWPLDRPLEVVEGEAGARSHLESCADCQAFFARDAALDRVLERLDTVETAPRGLRDGLVAALDAAALEDVPCVEPARGASKFRELAPWVAVAAALTLAAVGTFRALDRNGPSLDQVYVEAYMNRDAEVAFLTTADPTEASEFFVQEFGAAVVPVVLDEGSVSRAVVCDIEGDRAAMVEYELQGHDVAHYRVPATASAESHPMHSATEDGVCVVRWSDGEYDHALVADIAEPELRMIAERQFAALR